MKMNTQVWARFESKGKPELSATMTGAMKEVLTQLIQWTNGVYMGSYIRITFARTEAELIQFTERQKGSGVDTDIAAEFEALISALPNGADEE